MRSFNNASSVAPRGSSFGKACFARSTKTTARSKFPLSRFLVAREIASSTVMFSASEPLLNVIAVIIMQTSKTTKAQPVRERASSRCVACFAVIARRPSMMRNRKTNMSRKTTAISSGVFRRSTRNLLLPRFRGQFRYPTCFACARSSNSTGLR